MRPLILAAAMVATAAGAAQAQPAPAVLKLDAAVQRRLGIATAPLRAMRRAEAASGFARGLDPTPLATLDADIAAAAAAAAASQAEASRTRALNAADQTVSRKVAEAAAAQARGDAVKLQLLRRRVGLEWGPGLAALSDEQRGRLISDISLGRAALVRIDMAGASLARGSATIDLGPTGRVGAAILGPARVGDPRLQTTGALALVRGPQALQLGVGAVAPVTVAAGAAHDGVVIPRAALLRTGGQTFAYVRRDAGSFERRVVLNGRPVRDGLFVSGGFRTGEAVVVQGAAQLLAAQTPSQAAD